MTDWHSEFCTFRCTVAETLDIWDAQLFASGEGIDWQNLLLFPFQGTEIVPCSENDTQWSHELVLSKRSGIIK